jgi:hypothetical protein
MQQSDFDQCQDFINKNLDFLNSKEDCCKLGFAFQKLNPSCLILLSQIIAIDLSFCLPANQQNVVSNFLMAIGQSIALFNAQQVYMESGPGNCFNLKNLNSSNPDCTSASSKDSSSSKVSDTNNTCHSDTSSNTNTCQAQIDQLNAEIKALKRWMDEY